MVNSTTDRAEVEFVAMGWFGRKKAGPDPVSEYTKVVEGQIAEARALLADCKEFDPRKAKHATLVRTILVIASNIPETRMAHDRSLGWNEAKLKPFIVNSWSGETEGGHSHAQRITYGETLVIDWVSEAGNKDDFKVVRLGSWCEELFELVLQLRRETEESVRSDAENVARRAAEFQENRYKPLD